MANNQQNKSADLDERKQLILKTIVESYIKSPSPISSKIVGEICNIDVSTATIRSQMHSLEEEGYLTHLHTSSGKIPTDRGYRYFVDNYVSDSKSNNTTNSITNSKPKTGEEPVDKSNVDALTDTANKISQLSSQTAIVIKDANSKAKVSDVHTSLLADGKIVVALIMDDSSVERVVIESGQLLEQGAVPTLNEIDRERLKDWEAVLMELVCKKGLGELSNNLMTIRPSMESSKFIDLVLNSIERQQASNLYETTVHLSGVAKLAENTNKEIADNTEITTKLLLLLEQQMELAELIKKNLGINTDAKIGSENSRVELKEHSMVLSPFATSMGETGALGVIGPKRMDYKKVFNLLDRASVSINSKVEE